MAEPRLRRGDASYGTCADLALGCPEKFNPIFYRFIWNFKRTHDAMMEEALARDVAHARMFRLRSDGEIMAFMSGL